MITPIIKDDKIDFLAFIKFFNQRLKKIIYFSLLITIIFNLYFIFKTPQYTSKISFYTNYGSETQLSFLGSFASNYLNNENNLTFSLKHFIQSDLFLEKIVQKKYNIENNEITLIDFWGNNYKKITLNPIVLLKNINTNLMFNPNLSIREKKLYASKDYLSSRIEINEDSDSSLFIVTIKIKEDPTLAKEITQNVFEEILNYSNYIVKSKAEEKTKFINNRLSVTKKDLRDAEDNLLAFLEKNKNLNSPNLILQKNRLEREILLFSQTYNTLSDQLELSKIEEKNTTSSIYILDTPNEAFLKSGVNFIFGNIFVFITSIILKTLYLIHRNRKFLIVT